MEKNGMEKQKDDTGLKRGVLATGVSLILLNKWKRFL